VADGVGGHAAGEVASRFAVDVLSHDLAKLATLVLNSFHGFSRSLRSLLDPSLGKTIKEFAHLDGAFSVQADGIVLSAGTYVVPKAAPVRLPSALGTRYHAAAAITAQTQAMAITVSQSTGTVTVFQHGHLVMKLERSTPMRS
jgi:DNA integrity scanning protein DisA with diadenylate cyclase activity